MSKYPDNIVLFSTQNSRKILAKHEDKCFPYLMHKIDIYFQCRERPRFTVTCMFRLRRATRRQMAVLFPVILGSSLFGQVNEHECICP